MRQLWAEPERRGRPDDTDGDADAIDIDADAIDVNADARSEPAVSLLRPTILGFLATTAITIGACQPASPFTLKQPDAWYFGIPDPGVHAGGLLLSLVLVFAGMLVLSRVWYDLVRALDHHQGVP